MGEGVTVVGEGVTVAAQEPAGLKVSVKSQFEIKIYAKST